MDTELLCMAVQGSSWPQAHVAIGTKSGNVLLLHGDFGTLSYSRLKTLRQLSALSLRVKIACSPVWDLGCVVDMTCEQKPRQCGLGGQTSKDMWLA